MLSAILQMLALVLLPVGLGLVFFAIGGPVLGVGVAAIVLSPELWFFGRELDLQQERGVTPR